MNIAGFNKTTLLDYPHHLAATIFFRGCDFRCPFCHNSSLVLPERADNTSVSDKDILSYLKKRSSILEGVCITGGEPSLQAELPVFIEKIKQLGLKVKLDTNGNHPELLQFLIKNQLIDYIAMDIKNSLSKYGSTIGIPGFDTGKIEKSVKLIRSGSIPYEFRTTIVKELHTKQDIQEIGIWLSGSSLYYLQSFEDSGDILCPNLSAHTKDTISQFQKILSQYITQVAIRGL